MSLQVAVIGAGVIGLSTAICLQERIPNAKVTLIADKFLEKTLSNGAGALFRGDSSIHSNLNLNETWLRTSYIHFTKLANVAAAEGAVNNNLSLYNILKEETSDLNPAKNDAKILVNDQQNLVKKEHVDQLYEELNEINHEISKEKSIKKALEKTLGAAIGIPTIATTKATTISPVVQPLVKTVDSNLLKQTQQITLSSSPIPSLTSKKNSTNTKKKNRQLPDHGVRLISGYHLSEISENVVENKLMSNLIKDWHQLTSDELNEISQTTNGLKFTYGYSYTTVIIEPSNYLNYLINKFISSNGQTIKRHISFRSLNDFEYLRSNFHVIFNCTGLGAKKLLNDHQMVPIRGQTVIIKFNDVKNFYTFDGNYIYPRFDGTVILGGCKQYDQWNQQVNKYDREMILRRCRKMLPILDDGEVIGEFVGLRPHRSEIRIERERIYSPDKDALNEYINVVHNYGHGGSGFTYSYGTAVHAVKLIDDLVNQQEHLELLP